MIIVRIFGGLGNQMFQYAFGRALAGKLNDELKLDISFYDKKRLHTYSLMHFNIQAETACRRQVHQLVAWPGIATVIHRLTGWYLSANLYFERSFSYDPAALEITGNRLVSGYWQSERYFSRVADTIRKEFSLRLPVSGLTLEISERMAGENAVGIHVRRGDYVSNKKIHRKHGICTPEYYQRAVARMEELVPRPRYYMFSDEPGWVEENFHWLEPKAVVGRHSARSNYEDLYLMTQCRHHIIANSSFSWWGAWLNANPAKVVIAPQHWFSDKSIDTRTILPESWSRI